MCRCARFSTASPPAGPRSLRRPATPPCSGARTVRPARHPPWGLRQHHRPVSAAPRPPWPPSPPPWHLPRSPRPRSHRRGRPRATAVPSPHPQSGPERTPAEPVAVPPPAPGLPRGPPPRCHRHHQSVLSRPAPQPSEPVRPPWRGAVATPPAVTDVHLPRAPAAARTPAPHRAAAPTPADRGPPDAHRTRTWWEKRAGTWPTPPAVGSEEREVRRSGRTPTPSRSTVREFPAEPCGQRTQCGQVGHPPAPHPSRRAKIGAGPEGAGPAPARTSPGQDLPRPGPAPTRTWPEPEPSRTQA